MIYRYTCAACGIVIRIDHQATGREVCTCMCAAEILEEVEEE